jgi:hypothetical protein
MKLCVSILFKVGYVRPCKPIKDSTPGALPGLGLPGVAGIRRFKKWNKILKAKNNKKAGSEMTAS